MKLQSPLKNYLKQSPEEVCTQLETFFSQQMPSIDRKLVRDLSFISQLAHYKEDMQVKKIEPLQTGDFYLHVEYHWHIFNGCMGMDEVGSFKDKVKFSLDDEGIVTLDLTAFEVRSTADDL